MKPKRQLTKQQFRITQLGETEPPFSGTYVTNKEPGIYRCVVCDAKLFSSKTKYDSGGTGWPSFWEAGDKKNLKVNPPWPKRPGLPLDTRMKPRTESPKETTIHPHHEMAGLSGTVVTEDNSQGMIRTEAKCGRCGAHLGHVFDDGSQPTGQRYCINSAALEFEKTPTK